MVSKIIKLGIVDDHPIVLEGLVQLFKTALHIKVTGKFSTALETLEHVKKNGLDVILIDIFLKDDNGLELILEIKKKYPSIFCIAISSQAERSFVLQALQNGASGYLLKDSSLEEILINVQKAMNGEIVFSKEIKERILLGENNPPKIPKLTRREKEIITLLADGKSSNEIAEKLFLSFLTVQTHRRNILHKLEVKNVAELISFCNKHNLL